MSYELSQEFNFDAAHTLKRSVPLVEYQPSTRIHCHSYSATVTVTLLRIHSIMTSAEYDRAAARLLKILKLEPVSEVQS